MGRMASAAPRYPPYVFLPLRYRVTCATGSDLEVKTGGTPQP